MSEHSPEPWTCNDVDDAGEPGHPDGWFIDDANGDSLVMGMSEADARRAAACVNACKGISLEDLDDPQKCLACLPTWMVAYLKESVDDVYNSAPDMPTRASTLAAFFRDVGQSKEPPPRLCCQCESELRAKQETP